MIEHSGSGTIAGGAPAHTTTTTYRVLLALVIVYALLLVVLSVDVMVRLWSWRARLDSGNLAALLFFEVSRTVVTVVTLLLIFYMVAKRDHAAWRPLTLALAFAAIWHSKAFGFSGFPGAIQESMAVWLRAHNVRDGVLRFVFGSPAWDLWASAASLLFFSAVYPRPLSSDDVRQSGGEDRSGLMRGAGVAGADIGALFRALCSAAIDHRWLTPLRLTAAATVWIAIFHVWGASSAVRLAGALVLALITGMVVTNLRAARRAADVNHDDESVRVVTHWLARGAIAGAAFFGASALASLLFRETAPMVGVVLLGVAPMAAVTCVWFAVLSGRAQRPAPQSES